MRLRVALIAAVLMIHAAAWAQESDFPPAPGLQQEAVQANDGHQLVKARKACGRNDADCLYQQGYSALQNGKPAGIDQIRRAAERGHVEALLWSGRATLMGSYGLARNHMVAAALLAMAGKRGNVEAANLAKATMARLERSQRVAAEGYLEKSEAALTAHGVMSLQLPRRRIVRRPTAAGFAGEAISEQVGRTVQDVLENVSADR